MKMKSKKQNRIGLAGWFVSIPLALIGILILVVIFFEGRKVYWDNKVRELCEKDGGITVYETVQLNEDEYRQYINQFGKLSIPREDEAPDNVQYVYDDKRDFIHQNNPTVRRYEFIIKRRSDNKTLGKRISYSRVGGDFFALDSSSSFRCPEKVESLFKVVMKKNKEE